MERGQKAIHLRTGDRGTDGAVLAWLERHGVQVIACADAFEACTFALANSAATPGLALIGADWLAPDELSIVGYFRETWPGITIVIYGSAAATERFEAGALTQVYGSPDDLRRMLASAPSALVDQSLENLRAQPALDAAWQPPPAAPRAEERAAADEAPRPHPVIRTGDAEATGADLTPKVIERHLEIEPEQHPLASQTILTKEELAALLDDEKK